MWHVSAALPSRLFVEFCILSAVCATVGHGLRLGKQRHARKAAKIKNSSTSPSFSLSHNVFSIENTTTEITLEGSSEVDDNATRTEEPIVLEAKISGVKAPYDINLQAQISKDDGDASANEDYEDDIVFAEPNASMRDQSSRPKSNCTGEKSWKTVPANLSLQGCKHLQPLPLMVGNTWSDKATFFDDAVFLKKLLVDHPEAELVSVTISQNKGCVKGIQSRYRTSQGIVDAPLHHGGSFQGGWYATGWPDKPDAHLSLEPGEHITRVIVRVGEILDRLELHTDRGQSIIAGGPGGADQTVEIEHGSHVFGFSGHEYAGSLVRLGFHVRLA